MTLRILLLVSGLIALSSAYENFYPFWPYFGDYQYPGNYPAFDQYKGNYPSFYQDYQGKYGDFYPFWKNFAGNYPTPYEQYYQGNQFYPGYPSNPSYFGPYQNHYWYYYPYFSGQQYQKNFFPFDRYNRDYFSQHAKQGFGFKDTDKNEILKDVFYETLAHGLSSYFKKIYNKQY